VPCYVIGDRIFAVVGRHVRNGLPSYL